MFHIIIHRHSHQQINLWILTCFSSIQKLSGCLTIVLLSLPQKTTQYSNFNFPLKTAGGKLISVIISTTWQTNVIYQNTLRRKNKKGSEKDLCELAFYYHSSISSCLKSIYFVSRRTAAMINVHGICDILHSKVANKYWELAVHYQLSKNSFLNIWAGWNLSVF